MLDETKIAEIAGFIAGQMKKAYNTPKKGRDDTPVYELADWGKLYTAAVKHEEEIEVHAKGKFPKELIGYTFPNESKEEMAYRHKSFQPITKPYWKKGVRTLNRIWSEQNYTIDWKDEDVKKYFTIDLPLWNDVRAYFKSVVTQAKIKDPNGVLTVAFDVPTKPAEDGTYTIDDTKEISPYPIVYGSEAVVMFEDEEFCVVASKEKSVVRFNGKPEKSGYVFYAYDTMNVWRIIQVGEKIDWKFTAELYYTHGLDWLPCWKLRGTPEDVIDDVVYYESHFAPALPHLNEAIVLNSTLKASTSKVAYPTRVYYDQDCNAAGCNNGKVVAGEGADAHMVNCSSCNGTGKTKFSPLRDYVHNRQTSTSIEDGDISFPGFAYVAPDSAILDYCKKTVLENIQQAFLFLSIDAVPKGMKEGLGEDATATASKIDRDEQFVSILDISNELFELLDNFLYAAYYIRYMKESEIVVSPPKTFELVSAAELTDELSKAKENGIPDVAKAELTIEYAEKRFSQNSQVVEFTKIAKYCDPLFTKDDSEVAIAKPNFQTWEIVLHYHIYNFLQEKIQAKPTYLDTPLETIKTDMVTMAKAKAGELNTGQASAANLLSSIATGGTA